MFESIVTLKILHESEVVSMSSALFVGYLTLHCKDSIIQAMNVYLSFTKKRDPFFKTAESFS